MKEKLENIGGCVIAGIVSFAVIVAVSLVMGGESQLPVNADSADAGHSGS